MPAPPHIPAPLIDYMEGLKTRDIGRIAASLADDLRFVTPTRALNRDEFTTFLAALYKGFPDWSYDHDPPALLEDGRYAVLWRQGGTHTGTLALPGFEPAAPTMKTVSIPPHLFFYRVGERGLTEIRPDPVPGGAPRGIFEQIGVQRPPV